MALRTGGVKPLRKVSEPIRERETFKYDPSLFGAVKFNDTGRPLPSSEIFTSNDTVLTALAQLATCQTGTAHSIISLFDADCQYYIAEATPSLPLRPGLPSDSCGGDLRYCGTAIPRTHSLCEYTLLSEETLASDAAKDGVLPVTVVQDLREDARFCSRPYCHLGAFMRFYAAVPIRSRRGINIGVLCVLNPTPIESWSGEHEDRLRNISQTIIQHLETKRLRTSHERNDRMNKGFGSFVEGKASVSLRRTATGEISLANSTVLDSPSVAKQQHLNQEDEPSVPATAEAHAVDIPSGGMGDNTPVQAEETATADEPANARPAPNPNANSNSATERSSSGLTLTPEDQNSPADIFSRASDVVRESLEVDGCLFLDATMGSYRLHVKRNMESEMDGTSYSSSPSSSEEDRRPRSRARSQHSSKVLAISSLQTSDMHKYGQTGCCETIPEKFLMRLLRRYPEGRVFNFDVDGEIQSLDSSEDDQFSIASAEATSNSNPDATILRPTLRTARSNSHSGPWARQNEGTILSKAFPGARSVAFVPVWDPRKERWFAGAFIYTSNPTRIFTIQGELSYVRALGVLATSEVLRFETAQADKAKSDALGSLSHELRSPLHGVLLGAELLNDTDLTVFQGNITHMIETCCRTLLDTIDHLLDYTKINSFTTNKRQGPTGISHEAADKARSISLGIKSLCSNIRLDGLVEEVMESVTAGFNFQLASVRQLSEPRAPTAHTDVRAYRQIDSMQAIEQLGPLAAKIGDLELDSAGLSILLSIDQSCNWMFHVHIGAIRRIIMNLFGNSLKYTQRGTIEVSLSQDATPRRTRRRQRMVKLVVRDTGKGISEDFLRYRLYKPFSQEDDLAPGTGLGLSLVKQIIAKLRGHISIESKLGVGTTVTVMLPLEPASESLEKPLLLSDNDKAFEDQVRDLQGLRIRVVGFEQPEEVGEGFNNLAVVQNICRRWLRMEVVSDTDGGSIAPDLVLWSDDALPKSFEETSTRARSANVVACPNILVAYRRITSYESADRAGIFEFVPQPIGPRKLAKTLLLAYKRWAGHSRPSSPAVPLPLFVQRPMGLERYPSSYTMPSTEASSTDLLTTGSDTDGLSRVSGRTSPANYTTAASGEEALADATPRTAPTQMLLVDDNHINLKILSTYMKKLGQDYQTASNGKEAVNAYIQNPAGFVCILMDISMPVMDGFEATRMIRAHERQFKLAPVPIFALTGLASEKAQQEAFGSGVDLFLTKPVKLKALGSLLASRGISVH